MAPLQFGIILYELQALDIVGPVDLLSSCSKDLLSQLAANNLVSPALAATAIDINFHYIGPTLDPVKTSAQISIKPTCTFETCPKLDALLLGGPGPGFWDHVPDDYRAFIEQRVDEVEFFFTTCTGGIVAGKIGVLDGRNATTNWEFLELAKAQVTGVQWKKERWVVDGKFWTAGGAFAGIDMMEEWVKGRVGREIVEMMRLGLDYAPRDLEGKIIAA